MSINVQTLEDRLLLNVSGRPTHQPNAIESGVRRGDEGRPVVPHRVNYARPRGQINITPSGRVWEAGLLEASTAQKTRQFNSLRNGKKPFKPFAAPIHE